MLKYLARISILLINRENEKHSESAYFAKFQNDNVMITDDDKIRASDDKIRDDDDKMSLAHRKSYPNLVHW